MTRRIDMELATVAAEVGGLPQLADLWDDLSDIIRGDREFEWTELMDQLSALEQNYLAGEMTADQATRYRNLLVALKGSLPILRRLGLELPSVSLDAEAA